MQALDRKGFDPGNDGVESIDPIEHERALAASKLSLAIAGDIPAQDVRQQNLEVELGRRVEDPAPLVSAQLPGTDPANLLHLASGGCRASLRRLLGDRSLALGCVPSPASLASGWHGTARWGAHCRGAPLTPARGLWVPEWPAPPLGEAAGEEMPQEDAE